MSVRNAFKRLTPPIALDGYRAIKRMVVPPPAPEWSTLSQWPPSSGSDEGWNHDSIVAAQRQKWPAFIEALQGAGPLGVAHEAEVPGRFDVGAQNTLLAFAYVLARLAHARSALKLLDWGCGLGHYAHMARTLAPDVNIDYVGKDLPKLIDAARVLNPGDRFFSEDQSTFAERADLVMASGSLHYSHDWRATLAQLAACATDSLYLARVPIVERHPSYVVVQRPHRWGYHTEYVGWFLNRPALIEAVEALGFTLEREFLSHESPHLEGVPEQCKYRGFWFRRRGSR
jgi:putative methyltransferase (TIGR04325 family)